MRKNILFLLIIAAVALMLCSCDISNRKDNWEDVMEVTFTENETLGLMEVKITNISDQTISLLEIWIDITEYNTVTSGIGETSENHFLAPGESSGMNIVMKEGETYSVRAIVYEVVD